MTNTSAVVRVLALSGKRFVGKDTLGALLVERARAHGITLERVALADESKRAFVEDEARQGRHVDLARLLGDRSYKESVRPRLSRYTEDALARDRHVFCRRVLGRPAGPGAALLLTDLRLASDAAFLRAACRSYLVRLRCDDATRQRLGWHHDPVVDTHWTETDLDDHPDWDEVVDNPGDMVGLGLLADGVLARYVARALCARERATPG
ncbi:MAG: hypothetical protein EOO75_21315 [Myxococcales bacterium]|nr:MAG: hypothetical protein EOO75_21315 [Myxococcales bacterium]